MTIHPHNLQNVYVFAARRLTHLEGSEGSWKTFASTEHQTSWLSIQFSTVLFLFLCFPFVRFLFHSLSFAASYALLPEALFRLTDIFRKPFPGHSPTELSNRFLFFHHQTPRDQAYLASYWVVSISLFESISSMEAEADAGARG